MANVDVNNALSDPTLELRDGNGIPLRSNDNWKDQRRTDIEATQIGDPRGRSQRPRNTSVIF